MILVGTVWFPDRVWEQSESGKWFSRPATDEDMDRRQELAAKFAQCSSSQWRGTIDEEDNDE